MTSTVTRSDPSGTSNRHRRPVSHHPSVFADPELIVRQGEAAMERGDHATAAHLFALAGGAQQHNDQVHRLFNRAVRALVPRWHFAMLNDRERNDAYRMAIEKVVRPGDLVLDIGTGAGLLALLAAQAGAELVVSCEAEPVMAAVAQQIMRDNGVDGAVRVVPGWSTHLTVGAELPRRADVLVTEIFDCGLLGEHALPALRHASTELLAPGATMVPRGARLWGQLVHSPHLYGDNDARTVCGFDLSAFQQFRSLEYFDTYLHHYRHQLLSEPFPLLDFDFTDPTAGARTRGIGVPVTADGPAHAVAIWFELDLADGVVLTNSQANPDTHWRQAVQTFDHPVVCTAGTTIDLVVSHDDERVLVQPVQEALP